MTSTVRRLLLIVAVLFAPLVQSPATAAAESAAQQKCLGAVDKGFAGVSKAEGKAALGCIKAAASGDLAPATVAGCITADAKQKIAGAQAKAKSTIAKACTIQPDFGVTDLTGATTAAAAGGQRAALLQKFFGPAIEDALATKADDATAAACQRALATAIDRCWTAHVAAFAACVSGGLATSINDAAALGACRDSDPDGAVSAACDTNVQDAVATRCQGVDLGARLPGCQCQTTSECIRARTANSFNAALGAAANLPEAALVRPYARRVQENVGEAWVSPVYGDYVASRIVGREEDAPLACPLGAVNIYTVQDAMADSQYNSAILPLLLSQGIRILFAPGVPGDVTGSSPAALVQGTQAMPLYGSADDFLHLSTRSEVFPLVDLKHRQVGDTLHFGFEHCLYNCDAIYAFHAIPPIEFGTRLLVIHVSAARSTLEDAVAPLAAEAAMRTGVELRWVGRTVGDFHLELTDGSNVQAFHALEADGTVIYELDPSVNPATDVLTLPALSAFLAQTTNDAVVLLN
ncbi:MAG TPA: hypothetical protein VGK20_12685 [Candidatus Binatia bacterium]|jgi:hypothetical protein